MNSTLSASQRKIVRRGVIACPYGEVAFEYRELGWQGVIPVARHGAKAPLVRGVTGHDGQDPDDDYLAELVLRYSRANIGLRLPLDVIGLDVDAYDGRAGARTLGALEQRLGPLTETWRSTSRMPDDPVSGIYLFRAPRRRDWLWVADLGVGSGIEIIQRHHRFVTVPPSVHNIRRLPYEWWRGSEEAATPRPGDLPLLPAGWARYLLLGRRYAAGAVATDEAAERWYRAVSGGAMCALMLEARQKAVLAVREANECGGLHDCLIRATTYLCRLAAEGHPGLARALGAVEAEFGRASRARGLRAEWLGAVASAKRQAAAREQSRRDPCRGLRGINNAVMHSA